MNKLLVQAVDCTIAGHIDRIVDMLYKLAVSIEKQNLIASGEYDDNYESYIEDYKNYLIEEEKCFVTIEKHIRDIAAFINWTEVNELTKTFVACILFCKNLTVKTLNFLKTIEKYD